MSQFKDGGCQGPPTFNIEGMADMLMEHEEKINELSTVFRGDVKIGRRGAYLKWLDNQIGWYEEHNDEPPCAAEALREARKSFTDEFYPK